MAGIKIPLTDVVTKLRTLTITNGDGSAVSPYVRVWNNQVAYFKEGKMEAYRMPALFVEVVNDANYMILGQGFRSSDLSFKIHIVHEFYDAQDGTFEQDLKVFDLRDQVIANLTSYTPTACGPLNCMSEMQDFEHDNVYHMVLDFICNFTDSIGSKYDAGNPNKYIETVPPTNLQIDLTTRNTVTQTLYTVAAWTAYSTQYTATADGQLIFTVYDINGNLIIGANIVSVIKEILTLTPVQYIWNPNNSVMSLVSNIPLALGERVFIIYQLNR